MGPVALAPQAAATVQLVAAMVLLVAAGAATVLLEGIVALLVGGAAVVAGVGVAACLSSCGSRDDTVQHVDHCLKHSPASSRLSLTRRRWNS